MVNYIFISPKLKECFELEYFIINLRKELNVSDSAILNSMSESFMEAEFSRLKTLNFEICMSNDKDDNL
jgi:hypothetical protein